MTTEKYYSGTVRRVLFSKPSDSFYIVSLDLDVPKGQRKPTRAVSAKGYVHGIKLGQGVWFGFKAKESQHPKYGRQLDITVAPALSNEWDMPLINQMMESARISALVRMEVLDQYTQPAAALQALSDAKVLASHLDWSPEMADRVVGLWQKELALYQGTESVSKLGLSPRAAARARKMLGDKGIAELAKNPWRLVTVPGISFEMADQVARRLGLEPNEQDGRLEGAILHVLQQFNNKGDVCTTAGSIYKGVRFFADFTRKQVGEALVRLHKRKDVVIDNKTTGDTYVYLWWYHHTEKRSAEDIMARKFGIKDKENDFIASVRAAFAKEKISQEELLRISLEMIEQWGQTNNMKLSNTQKKGVLNALIRPVSILTGLPGTGKTTCLRAVVDILTKMDVSFLLCAPTGIAAKRMKEVTGVEAFTIHRALGAQGVSDQKREATYDGVTGSGGDNQVGSTREGEDWKFSEKDRLSKYDVVIIDESSMVDIQTLYRVACCIALNSRLVFVGDAAQLPSVGPGNILHDLANCDQFPVIKLTEIFRQEDTSDIVFAAHAIHKGEMPIAGQKDFLFVEVESEADVAEFIVKKAVELTHRAEDFQVISPRHAGTIGVTALNQEVRKRVNPGSLGLKEFKTNSGTLREGDRVMVVKNDYKIGVFNGDVGQISKIAPEHQTVSILIDGPVPTKVDIDIKQAPRLLRLAYACTVHKVQGLEFDVVVIPIMPSFKIQLQRNLLYTAVTRAKKKVILVGAWSAVRTAVGNNKTRHRETLLDKRLQRLGKQPHG